MPFGMLFLSLIMLGVIVGCEISILVDTLSRFRVDFEMLSFEELSIVITGEYLTGEGEGNKL